MLQLERVMQKTYEIKYHEQNVNGFLKESSLLNILQDIATLSAESLGFGPTFVFSNNYAWVVLKYHLEFYKEIKDISSINVKTEPRGISKLYAFRDFEICSEQGELLGRVASSWVLIDMNSRKMLPMQKVLDFMPAFEKRENDLEYGKVDSFDVVTLSKTFDVRFDDIDVNRHANNSNYIVWALETLPDDFRLKHWAKNIDIKYRKEVGLGASVRADVFVGENYTLHKILDCSNDEELCSLKIEWS